MHLVGYLYKDYQDARSLEHKVLNRSFNLSRWLMRFVMWVFIVFPGQCAEASTSAVSTIAVAIPSLFFIMTLVALISNMR